MNITWFGTASVAIETAHSRILFDPFIPFPGSEVTTTAKDFDGYDHIFVTHGHVDHIASIPALVKGRAVTIHCTETPADTLIKKGVSADSIHRIKPNDTITVGDMELQVLQGRHIRFDLALIAKTLLSTRVIRHAGNIPGFLRENAVCKENGEIVCYAIRAEGKTLLLMGSLGFDPSAAYPGDADWLILPFQGASDLVTPAAGIIGTLKPRNILLDHFDDTFPPVSSHVPLEGIKAWLKEHHPEMGMVVPEYREKV
ncbi:MAG: MBL fold metallo-hydrolase [Clostridia bacterium]|nr:MBL fold metallo-hydrolase [Clostridia bacterium]